MAAGLAWTLDRGLALGWAAAMSRAGRAAPVVLAPGPGWRVDTSDRAGIMFAGTRDTARRRGEALKAHAAWGSRFPTWHSLFGTAELPA